MNTIRDFYRQISQSFGFKVTFPCFWVSEHLDKSGFDELIESLKLFLIQPCQGLYGIQNFNDVLLVISISQLKRKLLQH